MKLAREIDTSPQCKNENNLWHTKELRITRSQCFSKCMTHQVRVIAPSLVLPNSSSDTVTELAVSSLFYQIVFRIIFEYVGGLFRWFAWQGGAGCLRQLFGRALVGRHGT